MHLQTGTGLEVYFLTKDTLIVLFISLKKFLSLFLLLDKILLYGIVQEISLQ